MLSIRLRTFIPSISKLSFGKIIFAIPIRSGSFWFQTTKTLDDETWTNPEKVNESFELNFVYGVLQFFRQQVFLTIAFLHILPKRSHLIYQLEWFAFSKAAPIIGEAILCNIFDEKEAICQAGCRYILQLHKVKRSKVLHRNSQTIFSSVPGSNFFGKTPLFFRYSGVNAAKRC